MIIVAARRLALSTLLVLALVACSSAPAPAPVAPGPAAAPPAAAPPAAPAAKAAPAVVVVRGPGVVRTPAGAKLQVPAGFVAEVRGPLIELIEPDRAARVFLVEVSGPACAPAVRAAWALADPAARWKLDRALTPPPTEGYDEVYAETYVRQPDRRSAQAIARRKGQRVWVALTSGPPAALDKRAAQIRVFLVGMEAPGVVREDLSTKTPRPIAASRAELLAFIRHAMEATKTPGLAIAVVEGDQVVFSEGFGVREVGKPAAVTPDTRMMIGSVSKSMTTLMMATAVDDQKLQWTARAVDVEPRFKLGDEKLTAALKVEELVCACAGLPRKDVPLIMAFKGKTADDVFRELAAMRPSTGLRETFQYQNHMVAAGGYVAAHAVDPKAPWVKAYARAMQRRVFAPMGMRSTTLDHDAAIRAPNRATPHSQDLEAKHHPVSLDHERFAKFVGPSGGIWSTANDMARYLRTELAGGVAPGGKRVVSEANLLYRRRPQVKISTEASYALGWTVMRRKGLDTVSHGGGTMGFATWLAFVPAKRVGVIMVSNGTGGHLVEGTVWARLQELWFGSDEKARERLDHAVAEQAKELARLKTQLSAPAKEWMAPFLGTFANDEVGKVTIKAMAGGYRLESASYVTRLMRHDRLDGKSTLIFTDPPLAGLELVPLTGKDGVFEMARAQERYVFRRVGK